jgi:hypothetical protein
VSRSRDEGQQLGSTVDGRLLRATPPLLPFFHPPIKLPSLRPRGRLHLDQRIDFSAICVGTSLDLIISEIHI